MLRTLWDSPALSPIAAAGAAAGLNVVLFGSVASRAMLWHASGRENFTLFDLSPHMSDIDIGHSGPSSTTPILRSALEALVPMASWFRWSILDRHQMKKIESYNETNIRVPLREVRIGTSPVPDSNINSILDKALQGRIDIHDSGRFHQSPRVRHDSEASAALIYLDAVSDLIELGTVRDIEAEVQLLSPIFDFVGRGIRRISYLSEDGRALALRRLWYLFSRWAARMGADSLHNLLYSTDRRLFSIVHILDANGYPASTYLEIDSTAVITSNWLRSGGFRFPVKISQIQGEGCTQLLADLLSRAFPSDTLERVSLAEGNAAISAVTEIEVRHGPSPSTVDAPPLSQEFAHIVLPLPTGQSSRLLPWQLTAVAFGESPVGIDLLPQLAVVDTPTVQIVQRTYERPYSEVAAQCTIRMNLTSAVSNYSKVHVILVGYRNFEKEYQL